MRRVKDIVSGLKVSELRTLAKKLGISGYSKMIKSDLIGAVLKRNHRLLRRELGISWWDQYQNHIYGIASIISLGIALYAIQWDTPTPTVDIRRAFVQSSYLAHLGDTDDVLAVGDTMYVDAEVLNVREGPGMHFDTIDEQLLKGTTIKVLTLAEDGWIEYKLVKYAYDIASKKKPRTEETIPDPNTHIARRVRFQKPSNVNVKDLELWVDGKKINLTELPDGEDAYLEADIPYSGEPITLVFKKDGAPCDSVDVSSVVLRDSIFDFCRR